MRGNAKLVHAINAALCATLLSAGPPARALELAWGADAGVGHTDNIARTATSEVDETIATVGAELDLRQQSTRLDASLTSRLEFLDYLDDTFDSDLIGSLVGNATVDIVRERFTWGIEDTFGQTAPNQFAPATPVNRVNVNYFSTGPDLSIPLGSRTRVRLAGRYSDVYYEDSDEQSGVPADQGDLGNERRRGELSLERELSSATNVSLNGVVEEVEFDDQQSFVDYERQEYFLRYGLDGARTTLDLEAGYTLVRQSGQEFDGGLARIHLTRRVSEATTVSLEGGRDFSDSGNVFRQLQTATPGSTDTQPVQELADPFENTYVTLRWNFFRNRTGMNAYASYFNEEYQVQTQFNRRRTEFGLNLQRNLSRTTTAAIGGTYGEQDYRSLGGTFEDVTGSASLQWRLGRASYLSVAYLYFDRNDDLTALGGYRENQVWLRFGYFSGDPDSFSRGRGGMSP